MRRATLAASEGSSPRMRGKLTKLDSLKRTSGLIPAHAGKTIEFAANLAFPGAHPRACGENPAAYHGNQRGHGSSPRMRGKHRPGIRRPAQRRLIPAHAGKTQSAWTSPPSAPAHPRACGENIDTSTTLELSQGSSPRMRGKRRRRGPREGRRGLIPAHAGKTSALAPTVRGGAAHPRACGENEVGLLARFKEPGSSPRMRGKRKLFLDACHKLRLIPAHAGKTPSLMACPFFRRAHPRACGENTERSGVLALRSVRSWKTLSFPSSLKVTHCRAFVQLPFSRIRL